MQAKYKKIGKSEKVTNICNYNQNKEKNRKNYDFLE